MLTLANGFLTNFKPFNEKELVNAAKDIKEGIKKNLEVFERVLESYEPENDSYKSMTLYYKNMIQGYLPLFDKIESIEEISNYVARDFNLGVEDLSHWQNEIIRVSKFEDKAQNIFDGFSTISNELSTQQKLYLNHFDSIYSAIGYLMELPGLIDEAKSRTLVINSMKKPVYEVGRITLDESGVIKIEDEIVELGKKQKIILETLLQKGGSADHTTLLEEVYGSASADVKKLTGNIKALRGKLRKYNQKINITDRDSVVTLYG